MGEFHEPGFHRERLWVIGRDTSQPECSRNKDFAIYFFFLKTLSWFLDAEDDRGELTQGLDLGIEPGDSSSYKTIQPQPHLHNQR